MAILASLAVIVWITKLKKPRPIVCRKAPDPVVLSDLTMLNPVHARLYATRGVTTLDQLD